MRPIIAVDWGTSTLRAALVSGEGTVERRAESAHGVMNVPDRDFRAALRRLLDGWPSHPVVASGMVGSRQGWHEVPYVPCPAGASDIAAGITEVAPGIFIVPGLSCMDADGIPDVMRGEETQAIGAGIADGIVVLPGTHSKWVRLEQGRVVSFATFMTGEVFAVLGAHSILGRLMRGEAEDEAAFLRGAAYGHAAPDRLLSALFSTRTLGLFGAIPETGLRSYLSGLLVGAEIGAGARRFGDGPLTLVGAPALIGLYRRAFAAVGPRPVTCLGAEDATVRGLLEIARKR